MLRVGAMLVLTRDQILDILIVKVQSIDLLTHRLKDDTWVIGLKNY